MSPHAPPHLQHIAPVLLAGEDVRYLSKPDVKKMFMLGAAAAVALFVILFAFISLFASLPPAMTAASAGVFALAGVGILYATFGTRDFVITDQRLLILSGFTHEVQDSCELDEIADLTVTKYTKTPAVQCKNGKVIKLWAIGDLDVVRPALLGKRKQGQ